MLFEDTYHTINRSSEGLFKDKGSKFIALAFPVMTEEDVKQKLEEVKKQYHGARHHCYAWVLGFDRSAHRYNDDGEPSGTAGRPIFGQIQSFDLTNVLVVVVRYFGGTKLGVPGLINAYKTAAREALGAAKIIHHTVNDVYELDYEYPLMNDVMRVVKEDALKVIDQDFRIRCKLTIEVRKNDSNRIYEKINHIHGVHIKFIKTV
ncbi:MAG: YigZ family protein [Bacteroidales bacterium]|nr:YigZ family protein [Bacteroidales bacterium]